MEFLRQLIAGLLQTWRNLSASARVNIGLSIAATVILIVVMVISGSRPQYVQLYSQLSPDDSAAIISYLEERDIPRKVMDEGATIHVRYQDRSRLRVELRRIDLPKSHGGGGPGFEIFDETGVMASQALHDIKLRRAVQGELERMLNEFEFVNSSRVYIHQEEEALFTDEQKPYQAAITLDVNRPLAREEIKGVLGLVSSFGGPNLTSDNISLATTDPAQFLHLPPEDEFTAIANRKLDYKNEFERQREKRAESALAAIGVNSVVRVSLDIDDSTTEETKNEAKEGALLSSMVTNVQSSSEESLPEGPAGALANIPEGGAPGGQQTTETTKEIIENFEPTMVTTKTTKSPGGVNKALATVVVEGTYKAGTDDQGNPTGEQVYAARTEEELQTYRAMVASAIDPTLSPEDVKIFDHPFQAQPVQAPVTAGVAVAGALQSFMLQYSGNVVKIALVLLGFLLVRRYFLRSVIVTEPEEEEMMVELPEASPEELRKREMAAEVERASTEQPEAVAALIRAWLSEAED